MVSDGARDHPTDEPTNAVASIGARFDDIATRRELFRRFLTERDDPAPFYSRLAVRSMQGFPFPLAGRTVLDLGSGPGYYSTALTQVGASVVATDVTHDDLLVARRDGVVAVSADAARLPFVDGAFDGVFCSNLLEHVPEPAPIFSEIERVLTSGGWAWISWTNWYSPWGGHSITPFHYLGPRLGSRLHDRLKGPPERNPVFGGLWPAHIGSMLRIVRARPGMRMVAALPRYYQSQAWILKVPVLREFVTWNCLLLLERQKERSPQPPRRRREQGFVGRSLSANGSISTAGPGRTGAGASLRPSSSSRALSAEP